MNTNGYPVQRLFGNGETQRPNWQAQAPAPVSLRDSLSQVSTRDQPAEALLTDAQRKELKSIYERAYREGLEAAKQATRKILEQYQHAIEQLRKCRENILQETEHELIKLSLFIAHQVILTDEDSRRAFTRRMISEALVLMAEEDDITLRVSPVDLKAVQSLSPDLALAPNIRWVADPNLHLGGVVAHCELGVFDASLETRLTETAARLWATMKEKPKT